ncbi:MAG TPA: hypothetical protein VES88_10090 [Gemmatimonadaceae bacterium]|nr:hypothetical protein [Gemmatimonadaceae bacterium]
MTQLKIESRLFLFGLLPLFLCATSVAAQHPDTHVSEILRSPSVFSPSLASVLRTAAATFVLQGEAEDESAAIQLSTAISRLLVSATLKGEPEEGTPNTALSDLSGITKGTTGSLALAGVHWLGERTIPGAIPGRMLINYCLSEKRTSRPRIPVDYDCDNARTATMPADMRAEVDRLFAFVGTPILWGAEIKAGQKDFGYVDEVGLTDTLSVWQFSGKAAVGRFTPVGFLSLGVAYKRSYKEGEEANACNTIPGSSTLKCDETHFGTPARKQGFVGLLEVRRVIRGSIAANPRVSYSASDNKWVGQSPLYFVPNEKGGLIGGLIPSWTKSDGFSLALFIGTAFNMSLAKP